MHKRLCAFLSVGALVFALAPTVALAATPVWVTTQLTNGTAPSTRPLVSGGRVIWWGSATGTQLMTWKAGVTTALSLVDASRPSSLDGDRIAWFRFGSGVAAVQTWTQASGITTASAANSPSWGGTQVSGDRVVWADTDAGFTDSIFTWKPSEGVTKVSTGPYAKYDPVVSGDRVAWTEWADPTYQIFTRSVGDAGPVQLTNSVLPTLRPKLSGQRLIWFEPTTSATDGDVFTWTPTSTVTMVGPCTSADSWVVSGDRVVFTTEVDSAGGPVPEVMMWTPASGLATVTPGEDANADPDVSGDRLAWLHNGAVVTWKVGEAAPTTLSPAADAPSGVHVSQDRVVWEASDAAGQRQVFTAALLPRLATVLRALGNSSVRLSRTYTLKGSIAPKAAPGRVSIVFKRYYRKAWRKVGATKYATLKSGAWSYKYRPASRGSWRAYVSFGGSTNATAVYQAAKTVYKPFRVY